MRLALAVAVSMLSGFIALSYELVWVRVYDFMSEGAPPAFGYLLGAYLFGLAFGALVARRYCNPGPVRTNELLVLGVFLVFANAAGFCAIPAAAASIHAWGGPPVRALPIFAVVGGLLGTALPLAAHYAIPADDRAGSRLSYLYAGNILGSSAGSLMTGFVLLELFPLRELSLGLALCGIGLAGALVVAGLDGWNRRAVAATAVVAVAGLFVSTSPALYDRLWERLLYWAELDPAERFGNVIENRSGVVTVTREGVAYGGGSYDGIYRVDPHPDRDENRVRRAYCVAAFHPAPREVLVIGLGTGAWVQVLAHHPGVEHITAVEINPAYVEMLSRFSSVWSLRWNPKVEFVIDDGRRFMNGTGKRYDLIVQNTIVYWRAHATNLLSREYLELTRRHLKEGGIVYYNSTMSAAAQKTGASVFPHVWRYQNMIIASASPLVIDRDRWRRMLTTWTIDDRPVLPDADEGVLDRIVNQPVWRGGPTWEDRGSILGRTVDIPVITDDNMETEWWLWDTYP